MARRAAQVDANQAEIVECLRKHGWTVQTLAMVGSGCPDLLVGAVGVNVLLEIKVPKAKLNPTQKSWHLMWSGGAVYTVDSVQAAVLAVRVAARIW